MSKKITKTITNMVALNETSWYEQHREDSAVLSAKARLALKRNMKELDELAKDFYEMRDELDTKIREKYSDDKYSTETEIEDENGNKQPGRSVKDEYLDEYRKEIREMQIKLDEVLNDTVEVDLYVINLDDEVDRIDEKGLEISDATMDMISLFEDTEDGE